MLRIPHHISYIPHPISPIIHHSSFIIHHSSFIMNGCKSLTHPELQPIITQLHTRLLCYTNLLNLPYPTLLYSTLPATQSLIIQLLSARQESNTLLSPRHGTAWHGMAWHSLDCLHGLHHHGQSTWEGRKEGRKGKENKVTSSVGIGVSR
jgi:hypothetical protein